MNAIERRSKRINRRWGFIIYACIALLALAAFLPSKPTVAKAIEQDSQFKYATSITSELDHSDKAHVYTIDMPVPEAARYIMEKKTPQSYSDLSSQESIQLIYDDYMILIYKGENDKTYVQSSSRKYVHQNGYNGLYHPYHPGLILLCNRHYTSGGYYDRDNQRYGGGFNNKTSTAPAAVPVSSNKINTSNNSSSKIKTDSSASSKIKTSSGSVRSGSVGSRSSIGGGTSFGK